MKSRVGSWVTWVKGQSIDGSCRYRVTKYDSLSAPAAINIRLGVKKNCIHCKISFTAKFQQKNHKLCHIFVETSHDQNSHKKHGGLTAAEC